MTEDRASLSDASISAHELEDQAKAAAHAKFAQWHRLERDQQPRRVLLFSFAGVVIIVVTVFLMFIGRS
jgi:hypothetical protein